MRERKTRLALTILSAALISALMLMGCSLLESTPVIEVVKVEQLINDADADKNGVLSAGEILALIRRLRAGE